MAYLDTHGLTTLWNKIKTYVSTEGGKIDKIKVNSVEQQIVNKTVDISTLEISYDETNGCLIFTKGEN